MIKIPSFSSHIEYKIYPNEGVFVFSEREKVCFFEKIHENIFLLIDGKTTTDNIVAQLEPFYQLELIYFAILELENLRFIVEATKEDNGKYSYYHLEELSEGFEKKWNLEKISVLTFGKVSAIPITEALIKEGFSIEEKLESASFVVAVCDDYLSHDLLNFSQFAKKNRLNWMLFRPKGSIIWIGPFFEKDDDYCFNCLQYRIKKNQRIEEFINQTSKEDKLTKIPLTSTPSTENLAAAIACQRILQYISFKNKQPFLCSLFSLDTLKWESTHHQYLKNPFCPSCKQEKTKHHFLKPLELREKQPIKFSFDNGARCISPDITEKKYQHLVSNICGIVTNLDLKEGFFPYVYESGFNRSLKLNHLQDLTRSLRSNSAGKGMTAIQAKVSALCEALERFSGVYDERVYSIRFSYEKAPFDTIHPYDLMFYSDKQYKEREEINQKKFRFYFVPEPFNPKEEVEWTPVWSLSENKHKYLPTGYLFFDMKVPFTRSCSNGNASGNTLEEAILQGFFELIERDCVATWWYNRLQRPGVDIHSFNDPYIEACIKHYYDLNRDIWVIDITSDFQIPCFVCFSKNKNGGQQNIIFGFGCHFESKIALQRAISEMSQMMIIGDLCDQKGSNKSLLDDQETLEWLNTATVENQPYLLANTSLPETTKYTYTSKSTNDITQDVELCCQLVKEKNMELLVLNLTKDEIGIPTAKVIVPGLRHFWPRFAPGRLFNLPVELGWLDNQKKEEELNPINMFI